MNQAIATRIIKKLSSRTDGHHLKLSRDQIFFTGMGAWPDDTPPLARFVGFITKEKHAMRNFGIEMAVHIAGTVAKGVAPASPVPDWSGTMSAVAGTGGDTGSAMRFRGLAHAYQHGLKFITPSGEDDRRQFEHNRAFMSSQKWANNVGSYFILECYDTYINYANEFDSHLFDVWQKNVGERNLDVRGFRFPVVRGLGAQALIININGEAVPIDE
jgi:hypothetical protein